MEQQQLETYLATIKDLTDQIDAFEKALVQIEEGNYSTVETPKAIARDVRKKFPVNK